MKMYKDKNGCYVFSLDDIIFTGLFCLVIGALVTLAVVLLSEAVEAMPILSNMLDSIDALDKHFDKYW
jgi:uncharacterized membrane protein